MAVAAQAYLTNAEFSEQALTGDATSTLTAGAITNAILWASSHADSYIGKRYTLPLIAPFDPVLKMHVGALAAWHLLVRRGVRPGSGQNEILKDMFDFAQEWLEDISKGIAVLNGDDSSANSPVDLEGAQSVSGAVSSWSQTTGSGVTNVTQGLVTVGEDDDD